jgi:hypothetical protein
MELQGLGAFLSALGGIFSAQAGAKAGQLQGLLMGEDITERRKRMKMAEEAQALQKRLAEAEEARRAELFPYEKQARATQIDIMKGQQRRQEELFPFEKEALATQVEAGKLNLENTRLWTMYQRGVSPSQISDPVLRAQYEPFFNYLNTVQSLDAVMSNDELNALLGKVSEEWRPTIEILGRSRLLQNQIRKEMIDRQMKGLDLNIAQGEFQLRTAKLNTALTAILSNIDREGVDWDKRSPQQKIETVKKWIAGLGLGDVVPEDFANMFQRVKSSDARQLALLKAQVDMQLRAQSALMAQQFRYNDILQEKTMWGNLVFGALGGGQGQGLGQGQGGVAPIGFPALPPIPTIFNNTYDNRGSNLNTTALSKYLNSAPFEISVPFGRGYQPLSVIGAQANAVYQKLGRPDATLSAEDINTLITFDAGMLQSHFAQNGMELDWNSALAWAVERVVPILEANRAYQSNINYQKTLNDWKRAWEQRLQQRAGGGGQSPASNMPRGQIGGQSSPPAQQRRGQGTPPPTTQGRIQMDRLDRQP